MICPVAGNVNFHHLIKMVFPRFLNLTINKCVVLISKYFVGRYFETMYAISYFHQTFVLVSIDDSYLNQALYSERCQMMIFLTPLFLLHLLFGIVQ